MRKVLGVGGMLSVLVSFILFAASTGLLLRYATMLNGGGDCNPEEAWFSPENAQWFAHLIPPTFGVIADPKCRGNGDEPGGMRGVASGEMLPGSSCSYDDDCWSRSQEASEPDLAYEQKAARFNRCVQAASNHYGQCVPNVDCANELFDYQNEQRKHAFVLKDGQVRSPRPCSTHHTCTCGQRTPPTCAAFAPHAVALGRTYV
jgi:hypothetical protein